VVLDVDVFVMFEAMELLASLIAPSLSSSTVVAP
jgi:hypothetical protein